MDDDVSEVTLRFIVPLEIDWVVDAEALDQSFDIVVAGSFGRVFLPRLGGRSEGRSVAPDGFELSDGLEATSAWYGVTSESDRGAQVCLSQVGLEFNVTSSSPIDPAELDGSRLAGFDDLKTAVAEWIERFQQWTQLILGQPLDRTRPSPKLLNPRASQIYSWGEVLGHVSKIDANPGPISIVVDTKDPGPTSEFAIDLTSFPQIVELSNEPDLRPPLALELVAAARLSAQRSDWRPAITDLGTAAESLLRKRLKTDPEKPRTLGALISDARHAGIDLPAEIESALLRPRNAAVHRGTVPEPASVLLSLDMIAGELGSLDTRFSRPANANVAHRPQRLDLSFVV